MRSIRLTCLGVVLVSATAFAQTTSAQGMAGAPAASAPAAAKASPAAPAATATGSGNLAKDEDFTVRVKTMEEQVNDLKEKIFRTKARLLLLQESVLGGTSVSQGAKALLVHRNEMGSSFVLESATYVLDGAPVYTKVDVDGDLDKKEEFEFFNGRVAPGQHQLAVKLKFRGHGFGIFTYLEGYQFSMQHSFTFDAEPGRVTTVKCIAYEKGGITTDLKDRPAIRFDVQRAADAALKKTDPQARVPEVQR